VPEKARNGIIASTFSAEFSGLRVIIFPQIIDGENVAFALFST
jgi:hypothetical protein